MVEGMGIQQQRTAERKEFVIEVGVMLAQLPNDLVPGSPNKARQGKTMMTDDLRLDSVFAAGEVPFLLLLLERLLRLFVLQREGIC